MVIPSIVPVVAWTTLDIELATLETAFVILVVALAVLDTTFVTLVIAYVVQATAFSAQVITLVIAFIILVYTSDLNPSFTNHT